MEYETERLARQKIQYQEKLAKLSGCALPPWKKDEPPDVEGAATGDNDEDNEDDRESVSTSTSTASGMCEFLLSLQRARLLSHGIVCHKFLSV